MTNPASALLETWMQQLPEVLITIADNVQTVFSRRSDVERLLADLARQQVEQAERLLTLARQQTARGWALKARREQARQMFDAAHALYTKFGKDDEEVMAVWSLAVIDPEPPSEKEIAWALEVARKHGLLQESAPPASPDPPHSSESI